MLTKKFCKIRLGLHNSPSVHLLIPLSFSSNTKTAPLRIRCFRSSSFNLRRIFGMCPRLAASNSSSASCVEALFDPRRLIRRNLHAVNASSDSHVPLPAALCDAILRREHGRLGTLRGCLHCCKDQRALHPENLVWGAIIVTAIRRWMRRAGTELHQAENQPGDLVSRHRVHGPHDLHQRRGPGAARDPSAQSGCDVGWDKL